MTNITRIKIKQDVTFHSNVPYTTSNLGGRLCGLNAQAPAGSKYKIYLFFQQISEPREQFTLTQKNFENLVSKKCNNK